MDQQPSPVPPPVAWTPGVPASPPMPPAPQPVPPPAPPLPAASARGDLARRLAPGILGIVGGFVVLSAGISGQLPMALAGYLGMPFSVMLIQLIHVVFGVAAVVIAYLLAPGPLRMRIAASALFVVVVAIAVALAVVRITAPIDPVMGAILVNPPALLVLAGAFGWLFASHARPLAYLSLIPGALLLLPIPRWFAVAGLESALITLVSEALSLLVAVVVLVGSLVRRR